MEASTTKIFAFADFELDAAKRRLLKRGEAVALNSKTFDLLVALVENGGRVVSKNELLETVWANQFVEENNLTVQIAALRKIFGEKKGEHRFIVTVPGKGYKFVAETNELNPAEEIVIENHTVSRVVVAEEISEEEIEKERKGEREKGRKKLLSKYLPLSPSPLIPFLSLGFVVLAIIGGLWWQKRRQTAAAPFAGAQIKQLTTNGKVALAALSPDGKMFAYVTSNLGERALWLGYAEGGNHLPLRPSSEAIYHSLAFAPDSNSLYFSFRDEKTPKSAVYKVPVSGGAATKILDETTDFKLSPDGSQIAFARRAEGGDKDSIFTQNLTTGEKREIAAFPKKTAVAFNSISWSPDGTRLALAGNRENADLQHDVFVVEIATGAVRRVQSEAWRDIGSTVWTADGESLIVTAINAGAWSSVPQYRIWQVSLADGASRLVTNDRSSYGASLALSTGGDALLSIEHRQLNNIWIAPADDVRQARQITFSSFGKYDGLWGMDFAPDGTLIYTNSDTHSQFISALNLSDGSTRPLTAPGSIDSQLTVSNDGRHIVFLSTRTGGFNIWRMDVDGANPTQLTFAGNAFQSFVSADSRWAYYKSWENQRGEMRRVSLDGGAPEILNDRETSWGSASPDGKFIAASLVTDKQRLVIFSVATHEVIKQFDLPKNATLSIGSRWTPDSQAVIYRDFAFGLWKQSIAGGEPQRLEGLPKEKFYNFAFSKDGKQFAFVRGQEIRDVVLLQK